MSTDTAQTYVEDDPEPGTGTGRVSAALTVRLGVADTTYPQHGELHVLSRLALSAFDGYDVQGGVSVGTVTTRFSVSGEAPEVVGALEALAAWVRKPAWASIDDVVRAVRRDGTPDIDDELRLAVLARWGRDGIGLLGCAPHCGYAASIDRLDRWRSRFLTAGNVVLAGEGKELGDLALELPSGPLLPVPQGRPLPFDLPAWRRSPAAEPEVFTALTGDVAATRLLSTLVSRDLNRSPVSGNQHPGSRTRALPLGDRLLWLYTHGGGTSARIIDALERVAGGGPAPEEVEEVLASSTATPDSFARAEHAALGALLGLDGLRPLDEVTPDELVVEARAARASLLVLTADPGTPDLPEAEVPGLPDPGKVLHRYHARRSRDELALATHTCEKRTLGVRQGVVWDELVGVHRAEHDVRRLVPRDGPELWIDTHDWRHGRHALAMIDGHVDDELVVHEPDPYDVLHGHDAKPWHDRSLLALLGLGLVVLLGLILLGVWLAT